MASSTPEPVYREIQTNIDSYKETSSPKPPALNLTQIKDAILGNLTCVRNHNRKEGQGGLSSAHTADADQFCDNENPTCQDPKNEWIVHSTAVLILGVVADRLKKTDKEKAKSLVGKLEDSVGIHDPWHHRHLRSTLTDDEINKHYHHKATLLESLGNAEFDSSFDHLLSYVNNTDSPPLLRRSALSAIRKYDHHEEFVMALEELCFATKIEFEDPKDEWIVHSTAVLILGVVADRLKETDKERAKSLVGKLEDSVGIHGLTKGHVKVDVDDQIYARGLLGIIGERFDFIDAGICFKGGIKYEINILQASAGDYQDHNEELSAHWDFSGDPCPISKYEWSILKVDGTVMQPFTVVPPGRMIYLYYQRTHQS
uniref:Uncharacterized protein n=1 Tax=Branchiostoma floridae TaxID=7739 RepID=C4A0U0_BRAFL|eukprot:XP_002585577.1 hypothetical protein BRAFLDRAFT_111796 [Branchiostoma floridae]